MLRGYCANDRTRDGNRAGSGGDEVFVSLSESSRGCPVNTLLDAFAVIAKRGYVVDCYGGKPRLRKKLPKPVFGPWGKLFRVRYSCGRECWRGEE